MEDAREIVVVRTTVESESAAKAMAEQIVGRRLAACVQYAPIQSVYRWQGAIESAAEYAVVAKTSVSCGNALVDWIAEAHTYDTPEIVVTPVIGGSGAYLGWVLDETSKKEQAHDAD